MPCLRPPAGALVVVLVHPLTALGLNARMPATQDRVLKLSPQLLALLKEWPTRTGASEEERMLAGQLHSDFSR